MDLLPNILRSVVSSTMNVIFLLSLLSPKYTKKTMNIIMACLIVFNVVSSIYFYLFSDMTLIFKYGILLFIIYSILLRPLFTNNFMQWFFTFITVINIIYTNIVLSYSLSRFLPYPIYANTLVRLIIFLILIYLVKKFIFPLYQELLEYWNLFLFVALTIFIAFSYYFISTDNIIKTLNDHAISIHLLVLITYAVYISLFFFIKTISREKYLENENFRIETNQELLHLAASKMENQIYLLNEVDKKNSIKNHDRRHFNNTLLNLIQDDRNEEAVELLNKQAQIKSSGNRVYCENIIVNAAVSYYHDFAQEHDIETIIDLDIPNDLPVDSIELSMVISNLFENSIQACNLIEKNRIITLTAKYVGKLLIEIKNPYFNKIIFDEQGYPLSNDIGHGVGTKSIRAFIEKNDGDLVYTSNDNIFRVRLLV